MKFNFDFYLKNLQGEDIKDAHAGKTLAANLVNVSKGDVFKYYDWGKTLVAGKPLELDKSDQKKLSEFIENSEAITILTKAQLLEVFEKKEGSSSENGVEKEREESNAE